MAVGGNEAVRLDFNGAGALEVMGPVEVARALPDADVGAIVRETGAEVAECPRGRQRLTAVEAAIAELELKHAVITSVNRDERKDGGAPIFAMVIRRIRQIHQGCSIEVLIPDFKGDEDALGTVVDAKPAILQKVADLIIRQAGDGTAPSAAEYLDTARACLELDIDPGDRIWEDLSKITVWKHGRKPGRGI